MTQSLAPAEKPTKAEATRQRLLAIAVKEFQRRGFDKTTMRDLAKSADLSLGAFYYHFKSKDEVVHAFYEGTLAQFRENAFAEIGRIKTFEKRLAAVVRIRLEAFADHRELLTGLSRVAVDPRSPLSPFGRETRAVREATIDVFRELLATSDIKYDSRLKPYLPELLWMFMMSMLFFWIFDSSRGQKRTFELIDRLTPLIGKLIRFSRYPLPGGVVNRVVDVLKTAFGGEREK